MIARIEGAPAGTQGISLFLVPRTLVNDDGSLGERNAMHTASIEHKMGIRGSATAALNFDGATGYLIGEENRGLAAMFKMMNIERLTVGMQGLGFAEIAYQNALHYAQDRRQSKAPAPRPDDSKAADPIIYQPDVKRQLLTIRSQIEGGRALAAHAALHVEIMERSADENSVADAENTVALLTPVVKAFLTELGMRSTLSAQQIFGGHGYVSEHGMEQLVRDCRITPIYEGTNEIQALDLVTRKLTGKTGEFADRYLSNWQKFVAEMSAADELKDFAAPAASALSQLLEVTDWIRQRHGSDDAAVRGAATHYLRLFALTIIACLWTDIAAGIRGKDGAFYNLKRKIARFYMQQVLPETTSLRDSIVDGDVALADFDVTDFQA